MLITTIDDAWDDVFAADGTQDLPFLESDVAEPLAAVVEYGDYAETTVWAVVRLKDGRFGYVNGGCDTTGWDCQSGCSGDVDTTLEGLIARFDDEAMLKLCNVDRAKENRA